MDYSSEKDDWKKFEKNNVTIALNVLHAKRTINISCVCFKTYLKSQKTSYSFNDFKRKQTTMALPCSQKTICIIKG